MWPRAIIFSCVLLSSPGSVMAEIFNVAAGDVAGLAEAIEAANTNDEVDSIILGAGTFTVLSSDVDWPYFAQISSEISISGAGDASTLIQRPSSEGRFSFLSVQEMGKLTLSDLTIRGGGGVNGCGGAITVFSGGNLIIRHSELSDNSTQFFGGALCNLGGNTVIENSIFKGNYARSSGGAITNEQSGKLEIFDSFFVGNSASSGGAIYNHEGEVTINASVIVSNVARSSGGGLSVANSGNPSPITINIQDSTIESNTALAHGGGLNLHSAQASISKSTISNNTTGRFGGGIYTARGSVLITNSTISGNRAGRHGGGVMAHGESRVELNNLTVAYNVADYDNDGTGDGGGIYNHTGQRAAISNSILARNTVADELASECSGPVNSRGFNLVQVSSPGCGLSDFPSTSDIVDVDPLLEPLGNNGGLTDTHALGLESPAIDTGSPSTCEETDQRGVPRNCDIGAFELGVLPPDPGFQINAGLNDAWYNPETDGQGFFIIVFPETRKIFMSWFTYDTKRPSEDVTAILGEPGHRWLTAQGAFADNQASLDVYVTSGGVFDSAKPTPVSDQDGEVLLEFSTCNRGTVTYDIPSIERKSVVPIERIALDNVALCYLLNSETKNEATKQ